MRRKLLISVGVMIFALFSLVACGGKPVCAVIKDVPGGNPEAGKQAIVAYGCGACHTIPGVPGATTYVGPLLTAYSRRHYVAGLLPNTHENLIAWLQNPQQVRPGTAMPNLGLTEIEARNIAAYLYTLQ